MASEPSPFWSSLSITSTSKLCEAAILASMYFFVISWYVTTSSFSNHQSKSLGDFLLRFYSRRIKRLIPALLILVIIVSFWFAWSIRIQASCWDSGDEPFLEFPIFSSSKIQPTTLQLRQSWTPLPTHGHLGWRSNFIFFTRSWYGLPPMRKSECPKALRYLN